MKPSESAFLRPHRLRLLCWGIWHLETDSATVRCLYDLYFYFNYAYFCWFLFCRFLGGAILMGNWEWLAAANSLSYTTSLWMALLKCNIAKSKNVKEIISIVCNIEDDIIESGDATVKKIYKKHIVQSRRVGLFYFSFCFTTTILYIGGSVSTSIIAHHSTPVGTNATDSLDDVENADPFLSGWAPYDKSRHLVLSYLADIYGSCVTFGYIVFAGSFLFALFLCFLANIRILQHQFREFTVYAGELAEKERIEKRAAEKKWLRRCVRKHQDLIFYMKNLDEEMQFYTFMEFLSSSFKLCFLLIQLDPNITTLYVILLSFIYFICTILELSIYYWFGNEVIIESSAIPAAIFGSNFYELSDSTKKDLSLIIMRAQRPCQVSIGPLYVMCLDTLVAVLKTCYGYLSLINNLNERKMNED